MPAKRKLEHFDPNKSDSADTDFDPTEAAPRRSAKKSRSKRPSQGPRKRAKYKGSDVSDDGTDDSLLEEASFSEPEEEDFEMNEKTGRAVRKAAKKEVNYGEDSASEPDEFNADDESDDVKPVKRGKGKGRRNRAVTPEDEDEEAEQITPPRTKSKIIKLKINATPAQPARATRAGSAARSRAGRSVEPLSAGLVTRRSTRAHTEDGDEEIYLSNSGRHAIRKTASPEQLVTRATRGAKGVKKPAATIKEELHETSSYEEQGQGVEMPSEIAGTDEQDEQDDVDEADDVPIVQSDIPGTAGEEVEEEGEAEPIVIPEDEDSDDVPVTRAGRTRASRSSAAGLPVVASQESETVPEVAGGNRRLTRGSKSKQRKAGAEASSDFEPLEDVSEDELSGSEAGKKGKDDEDGSESSPVRRGRGAAGPKSKSTSRRRAASEEPELDEDELAEELQDLKAGTRRRVRRDPDIVYEVKGRRERKPVDYSIKPMDQIYAADEDGEDAAPTPTRRAKGGRTGASGPWERPLYTTFGPFGGGTGPQSVLGGPWGTGAAGGADSDSSDDENMARPSNIGGNVGMTPTSAFPHGLLPGLGQTNPEPAGGLSGTPAGLGKIKSQKALADADPLGVDQNVDFSKVGGLEGHIDQLKEMVQMPLLYPELFLKFHVTPPRGVLFHGPPGTGKTLLARALAASIGSGGQKITFYMRKGADALSKWVGEAERQLRLLFEEARKTQPSIIFFDEIDGLAPVRSSKQEQIHASIVSTLLALMDGMDGRGQVIVIGATNRPDNIDPALRRPGRFDREFYFPLPDLEGRKSILNIHTRDWGIDDSFKTSLAHATKGYGGADLRALCTEAALNSIQRTYPQIYSSQKKLLVDADKIKITAKDFMLSVKKMIPSSERSTSSGAAPLPKLVEPLLRDQLKAIENIVDKLIPIKKKTTALQEAMYEQYEDEDGGFGRETLQQEFEKSRVFRPRLLICGESGMGQAYLGGGLLNHFEGLHVQSFDLPTIYADSARSAEAAIVQLFAEVKRHKPAVIYLPGIDTWYATLAENVITTFIGMLHAIPPTDPVLVLGITDTPHGLLDKRMVQNLFGFSRKNSYTIQRPGRGPREEFFKNIINYVKTAPKDFPEPMNRKKRKLEVLKEAPLPPPKPPTKEEIKALKKRDHQLLNLLKIRIQPIMDQINRKYRKFRVPVIPQSTIQYLYDEANPNYVPSDIPHPRPYEKGQDKDGMWGLRENGTGRFFYNLETTTIEERLSNGYYARPKDFLADIRSLAKDAKHIPGGDKKRILEANELLANCEVDIAEIESNPMFAECEAVYRRQLERVKEKKDKESARASRHGSNSLGLFGAEGDAQNSASGPITLGVTIPGSRPFTVATPPRSASGLSNGISAYPDNSHSGNGNSVPSRHSGDDIHMGGTDELAMQPPHQQWPRMPHGPSSLSNLATGANTQISQRSGFQEIPHDASPSAIINDASTTTSGKKTSDGWSTQATNGVNHPESSPIDKAGGDSQLPDTCPQANDSNSQPTQNDGSGSSQGSSWVHSQAHAMHRGQLSRESYLSQTPSSGNSGAVAPAPSVPAFPASAPYPTSHTPSHNSNNKRPASMANILNDSPIEPLSSSQLSSQKEFIQADQFFIDDLLRTLVEGTSGCSVEQLEQINRELMEKLWEMRGESNRNRVATDCIAVFNETIIDIEHMQRVLQPSQPSQMS